MIGAVFGFSLLFSLDWRWRSPQEDPIQHPLFQGERVAYPRVGVEFGEWKAFLGPYHHYEPEDTRYEIDLGFFDLGAGKAFGLPLGFEVCPFLAFGLGVANSDWGVSGPQKTELGPAFFVGADAAWGPPNWNAKLLASGGYRVIPGWYPGDLHHQWEMGLGAEFKLFSGE